MTLTVLVRKNLNTEDMNKGREKAFPSLPFRGSPSEGGGCAVRRSTYKNIILTSIGKSSFSISQYYHIHSIYHC